MTIRYTLVKNFPIRNNQNRKKAPYRLSQILEPSHLPQSRLKQLAAMSFYLINKKRKQHQIAKHARKIPVAVSEVVLKMITLSFKTS